MYYALIEIKEGNELSPLHTFNSEKEGEEFKKFLFQKNQDLDYDKLQVVKIPYPHDHGRKCSHPYKKTSVGKKELIVGELDNPNWIIALQSFHQYIVTYHEGASVGTNSTFKTLDESVKIYHLMLEGVMRELSFEEMCELFEESIENVKEGSNVENS
jgi:hypothetical protein